MSEKRVSLTNVLESQFPDYIKSEYPLVIDFIKQYYQSQESQSAPIDLLNNIDQYIKLDENTNTTYSVVLGSDISFNDNIITIDMRESPTGTIGFPDSYGLLKIDDEIITYTSKTDTAFEGCVRGFCGITSYKDPTKSDTLVFNSTAIAEHTGSVYASNNSLTSIGSTIQNLSSLFLKEFLRKIKFQVLPGFEERKLTDNLNQNTFIKQAKDFYSTKGTDQAFEILFRGLYDSDVKIVKPQDFLLTPSNAQYQITKDLVVEPIEGNPVDLINSTIFQKTTSGEDQGYSPIASVEEVYSGVGQTYYRLSLDGGYNKDIRVDGSIYGKFTVQPTTKAIGSVAVGSTYITVDSTIGFPESGDLYVSYGSTVGIVSYTEKSDNQFFGVEGLVGVVTDTYSVGIATYAFGTSSVDGSDIKVRIGSVLSDFEYESTSFDYSVGDIAKIKTLGISDTSDKAENWFYNVAPVYKVDKLTLIDTAEPRTYQVDFDVDHYFDIGDSASLISSSGVSLVSAVTKIKNAKSIIIRREGFIDVTGTFTLRKNILNVDATNFPNANKFTSNVQNLYTKDSDLIVASSSISSYDSQALEVTDRSVTFSGTFNGSTFEITPDRDHGFYTGDPVYYTPEKIESETYNAITGQIDTLTSTNLFLPKEGLYFIKRIDSNNVKFANSRSDIHNSIFINFTTAVTVNNQRIEPYTFKGKTLVSQKLYRKLSTPTNDGNKVSTPSGFTGILINGVEILNYKSNDFCYYGQLENIDVITTGDEYDVINPPDLIIEDSVGTGATGKVSLSGSLREIKIVDPGFDYVEEPIVSITGGNGNGALASVSLKSIEHFAEFNSENPVDVGIGTTVSTLHFPTAHKFRNIEKVTYNPQAQKAISGLSTNSVYYARVVDTQTVKLHYNEADALAGIGTVTLLTLGEGTQRISSYNPKNIIESINVVNGGQNYQNKEKIANPTGISTFLNSVTITNHDYASGEVIKYVSIGSSVGGLSSGSEYYVTKVDDSNFKLSQVGVGTDNKDFYYRTNQYVDITSVGVGTHKFNYPNITVNIAGKTGESLSSYQAQAYPIFKGGITSVQVTSNGSEYGSSEVLNFNRQPVISLSRGGGAQLKPIISQGKIVQVIVLATGRGYKGLPNININGIGEGAFLTPILNNGEIESIKIIEPGNGYIESDTTVTVEATGSGAIFESRIQSWRVNLFHKNGGSEGLANIPLDDGYITNPLNPKSGLQYSHIYTPRKLRESVFAVDQIGRKLYGETDLRKENGQEVTSVSHSPVIGWAYDGNPIYGPYGYSSIQGGVVNQMKSGYSISLKDNRPSTDIFPNGFFIEDYNYTKVNDETVLDENNGRFCVTPEYPNGTYAYFTTIDPNVVDSAGVFAGYRRPVFPYIIGDKFNSIIDTFNYDVNSIQNSYDLVSNKYYRNTAPYNLIEKTLNYQYIDIPDNLSQSVKIKATTPGNIQSVGIETGGRDYQIADRIVLDDSETKGYGGDISIVKVSGKDVSNISVATTSVSSMEIYNSNDSGHYHLISESAHPFKKNDTITISGLSTAGLKLDGSYTVGLTVNTLSLVGLGTTSAGIGTDGVTGIVTYVNVGGDLRNTISNDLLQIEEEIVKVLNVDREQSRLRILRSFNNVGTEHTAGSIFTELPREFNIKSNKNIKEIVKRNKEFYFNPLDSVALGSTSGVGIGTTITFSNPGAGVTQLFVPTKTIYIKDNNLQTGDLVTYFTNTGTPLKVSNGPTTFDLTNQQQLFVAKVGNDLIGLSTVRVGVGTTGTFVGIASTQRSQSTLMFAGLGTGTYHSLKTNYDAITGKVSRNLVTVSTSSTHGLITNDLVDIDVNPSIGSTYKVVYNDLNRRTVVNPRDFADADIDVNADSIEILNHGYTTGQKVIHTAATPAGGLIEGGMYYVVKVGDNSIKLATTEYNATLEDPIVVNITATATGTISPINPPLKLYKDSTITFDLSDSSLSFVKQSTRYPAFTLDFFTDENFTDEWDKNTSIKAFAVNRTGEVGITTDPVASALLTVDKNTPTKLFYKLTPIFESSPPLEKTQAIIDNDVVSNSLLEIKESVYNGEYKVSVGTTSTFTYTIADVPEKSSYSSVSKLSYKTSSASAFGPISDLLIKNSGNNYYTFPTISTITSEFGTNAILSIGSTNIGQIKKGTIQNIGFNFPTDKTLQPSVGLPQIIEIDDFSTIKSIGITSVGRGYTIAPLPVIVDGKTNNEVKDVELHYTLGDTDVTIIKNTFGMSNLPPIVIPTRNSNGVAISTVGFNSITKDVTLGLGTVYSDAAEFPFVLGDKVLIENISVGVGSTGIGYNSSAYDYKLFSIKSITPTIGGFGTVSYNMSDELTDIVTPGAFDPTNSDGQIIAQKTFPLFNVTFDSKNFFPGETVTSGTSTGEVESWDQRVGVLRVSSSDSFNVGVAIQGQSSKTSGTPTSVTTYDAFLEYDATSTVEHGWQTNSGFINDNQQRVQDSFYYQNFSYALKSKIDFDTWNDVVSSLNHTLGFKKFSDYQLESSIGLDNRELVVGLTTNQTAYEIVSDLHNVVDLNCRYGYASVKENSLDIGGQLASNEVIFDRGELTDYFESFGNRVLSIDDLSPQFNSVPRATKFSVVTSFPIAESRTFKFITFVKDRRYTAERQMMIVDIAHDTTFAYINQYGRVETLSDMGTFDFVISGSEGQLLFYPTKTEVNDYDIATLTYRLDDNLKGIASQQLSGAVKIDTSSHKVAVGVTETVVGFASTYRSAKILVGVTKDAGGDGTTIIGNEFEFDELNVIHDGTDVTIVEYPQVSTDQNPFETPGLGTYRGYIAGGQVKIDFAPAVGVGTTSIVNTVQVLMGNDASTGIGTEDLRHARLQGQTTNIASSGTPTENVIAKFPSQTSSVVDEFDAAYFVVQVTDKTNNEYQMSEVIVVDDYNETIGTGDAYDNEYGIVRTAAGLGTIGSRLDINNGGVTYTELVFTPNANIAAHVNVYMNAIKFDNGTKDEIDLTVATIQSEYGTYKGTHSDVKRAFEVKHDNNPIFEKEFLGNNVGIVSTTSNTVKIPNHFFVSGEKVNYRHSGAGSTQAIGITSASFVGIGTTDKMPGDLYVIKIDDNFIKLASSAENSLKPSPQSLDIVSVGIGTSHRFVSTNQNSKVLVAIDNAIQSPVVASAITASLSNNCSFVDDIIQFTGITSFFSGDLIQVGTEIMKIEGVGIGSTNYIRVKRPWLGTQSVGYDTGALVTKVSGDYNIVGNTMNFVAPPHGNLPMSSTTNPPDSRDWVGVSTSSSFQGRSFIRSGELGGVNETYTRNYIFDDISSEFNSINKDFTLKSGGSDVSGIKDDNAIILINDIFQDPGPTNNYVLDEPGNVGVTTLGFVGTAVSVTNDVGISSFPKGGIILSVGSTNGLGYQPLVAAGGTAVVSTAGTISSISIGNTGSGYRSGIQPIRVGVATHSGAKLINVGTASVSGGHVTGIAVTNPHVFYKKKTINNVVYDNTTGITTITTREKHGLIVGDEAKLSGIAFTCDYSPRLGITTADYNNVVGIMTVTTNGNHGLVVNKDVIFTGLAFTCGLDNGASTHYYPRGEDPTYNTSVAIIGDGKKSTVTNASYNPTTGIMTLTVPSHGLSNGDKVKLELNSLTFTCAKDDHATEHSYPRATDPIAAQWVAITNKTTNTFRIQVLSSTPSTNTSAHTFVRATANGITLNDGKITIDVGFGAPNDQYAHTFVSATAGAVTSGGNYQHQFVEAVSGCISITGSTNTLTPTAADYNPAAGIITFTSAAHGLTTSDSIKISTDGIVLRCAMDNYASLHSYPRITDPIHDTAVSVASTTANTFSLNVGASPLVSHNVSAADYNAVSGIMTMTIGAHTLKTGTSIKLGTESLTFQCAKDGNATNHRYPRKPDPYYNGTPVTNVLGVDKFEVNIGISTVPSFYVGLGSVQGALLAPRANGKDPAIDPRAVLNVLSDTSFEVNTGLTTCPHFYARGGKVDKPFEVLIDEPLSYSSIPLIYSSSSVTGVGTSGTADIVVGQGSSVISFVIRDEGYGYGVNEILTVPIGGPLGIPTTSAYEEFQLTVQEEVTDKFTGWSIGMLQSLDRLDSLFDNEKKAFTMTLDNEPLAIKAREGSPINVQDTLLVFVNDILQVPGQGYVFEGGSIITFTEAPKDGDTCKIIFYKGSGSVDVVFRDIIDSVKPGDGVDIGYDPQLGQKYWEDEDKRVVTKINSIDNAGTNIYYGPGNTNDENLLRPVDWYKQTEDTIINQKRVSKARELYEPLVNPTAYLIKSVGLGSTSIFVDNIRPFFNPTNESDGSKTFQDKVTIISQDSKVGAIATATVNTSGNVTGFTISNAGVGYTGTPLVSIQSSTGTQATATASVTSGIVTTITVANAGSDYSSTTPPIILIDPPTLISETDNVSSYHGDAGVIVGLGTVKVGTQQKIRVDLHIPLDSYLRDTDVVSAAATLSSLSVNDYFILSNTNQTVGNTINSYDSAAAVIGIATNNLDTIYQVESASNLTTSVVGVGTTVVRRVFARVSGITSVGINTTSTYLGSYSWGRIDLHSRSEDNTFNAYGDSGFVGIKTSAIIQRTTPLKSDNYS